MDVYESEKYLCTNNNVRELLDKYGVCIVPNVLDENECAQGQKGMWSTLEHISQTWENPIRQDKPTSWRNISNLFPMHSMLIQHWGIGHSQFIWDIRQNPKVAEVFSKIWSTQANVKPEDLLVSFDGVGIHMPPEITNKGWFRGNEWYHSDQSFQRNGFECVQGFVSLFDINEGDATLSFLENSNQYHGDFKEEFGIEEKKDWYKLNNDERQYFLNCECQPRKIKCKKGSLVLWDSRTIHHGAEALRERAQANFRCVVYVCMTPREWANPKQLQKKQDIFNAQRMTSHWPHNPTMFPKTPRTYGAPLPDIYPIEKPVLSPLGLRLAGF